jgi:hypothetical protein
MAPFAGGFGTLASTRFRRSAAMHLEIPDGANVQIFVGSPASLALTDESRQARPARTGGRPILKSLVVAIALVGTFVAGQHFGGRATGGQTVAAVSMPRPSLPGEQHTFPNAPLTNPRPEQAASGVPAEFQNQLRQTPTVSPPPGEASRKNPFGLEP